MTSASNDQPGNKKEILNRLIQNAASRVLESHLNQPIPERFSKEILQDLLAPLSKHFISRIDQLMRHGDFAYEMQSFAEAVHIRGQVSHDSIAKKFKVERSTVTKWLNLYTIDFHRKRALFIYYRKYLREWKPISSESNAIYAYAWVCTSLRRDIIKSIPSHKRNPGAPQKQELAPLDCAFLRSAWRSTKWHDALRQQDTKSLAKEMGNINDYVTRTYCDINLKKHQYELEGFLALIREWGNLFELVILSVPDYLSDDQA
jgi:hypothetical protein